MNKIPDIDVYVRYCETDAGGHVNNTSYFIYLEEARTKFFATLGLAPSERKNLNFIVGRVECDFIAQAYAGQTLTISTTVSRIGTKSFTIKNEIKEAETGSLIAVGSAVTVCFNFEEQRSIEIPNYLRTLLDVRLEQTSIH